MRIIVIMYFYERSDWGPKDPQDERMDRGAPDGIEPSQIARQLSNLVNH